MVQRALGPLFLMEAQWTGVSACMVRAGVVDVCLIPEVDFSLEKLTAYAEKILAKKGHTVGGLTSHATFVGLSQNLNPEMGRVRCRPKRVGV